MWKIPLFDLDYNEDESSSVLNVLENKWLSMGEQTKKFEQDFEFFLGENVLCTAVSSCSAAIHIALLIANIKPEDEVIISSLTFVANANMVDIVGAKIVLADITSPNNWNMSITDTEKKITKKTKAIILVHYAGIPADITAFVELSKKYNIFLIEDVAHAIGASYSDKKCGTQGDISCFSFFSNKNLSTGEGGMLVTGNQEYARKAKLFRSHGMTSMTTDRHKGKIISYDVIQSGLNYRIDEIRSSLGIVQLKKLENNNKKRKEIYNHYTTEILSRNLSIKIPFYPIEDKMVSSYHIYPILLSDRSNRDDIIHQLHLAGIQTSIHYPSFKEFSHYQYLAKYDTPEIDSISNRILTLPLYPNLSFTSVNYIIDTLEKVI